MVATVPMFTTHAETNGECGTNASYILDDSGKLTITGTGEIRQYAFAGRTAITSAEIGSGITGIGNNAFMNCSIMTSVTIPGGVTTIGDAAFQSCSSLVSVNIPGSVTSIGNYAFGGCSGLTTLTFEGTSLTNSAVFFYLSSNQTVKIPNGFTIASEEVTEDNKSNYFGQANVEFYDPTPTTTTTTTTQPTTTTTTTTTAKPTTRTTMNTVASTIIPPLM